MANISYPCHLVIAWDSPVHITPSFLCMIHLNTLGTCYLIKFTRDPWLKPISLTFALFNLKKII
jgi:hypothetical protein